MYVLPTPTQHGRDPISQKIAADHKQHNEEMVASLDKRIADLHLKMRNMRTKNVEIIAELKDKQREATILDSDLDMKVKSCNSALKEGQDARGRVEKLNKRMTKVKARGEHMEAQELCERREGPRILNVFSGTTHIISNTPAHCSVATPGRAV